MRSDITRLMEVEHRDWDARLSAVERSGVPMNAYVKMYFTTNAQDTAIRAALAGLSPALLAIKVGPTFPVGLETSSPKPLPGQANGSGGTF